ncbi:MAG: primosomal protein N' [Candidatus Kapabacteria bacterium]|nr:primosomal protein N' [Candidatus Kapabacteria bacterium]
MDIIVKVVFPLPTNLYFSYKLDDGNLNEYPLVGRRVLAELGKKKLTGYIVEIDKDCELDNIKYVEEIIDEKPVLSENLIRLTKWISEYYMCSFGEAIKATLPQSFSPKSLLKIELTRIPDSDEINKIAKKAPKKAELIAFLMKHKNPLSIKYLQNELNMGSITYQIESLEREGLINIHTYLDKAVKGKKLKAYAVPKEILANEKELKRIFDILDKSKGKQKEIFLKIFTYFKKFNQPISSIDLKKEKLFSQYSIDYLLKNKFIIETELEFSRVKFERKENFSETNEALLPLTEEQKTALNFIEKAIEEEKFQPFLLYGVTGSGKTLIYIHTIKKVLSRNRTALLLVPEISLTPQLIDRFERIFGDQLSVQHSKMSEGERYDNWRSISEGKSKLVIGARSAIFAPLENIGAIIVDEEHEPTYKQDDPAPRYNARDLAIVRAKYENAIVLLGSATPSLESMYNAQNGKYELLKIEKRADQAMLPKIDIVNMLVERKNKAVTGSFSSLLIEKIIDRLEKKEGVILFLNRRGFASFLFCPDCGNVPMCKHCSVTLTYHKVRNYLRCHYCGFSIEAYKSCPVCGFPELNEIGTGTQKIEDELKLILESKSISAEIDRVDLDSTTKKGLLRKKLFDFYKGKINILIGTQLLAKGLDFDIVTLVGVVNPDIQLYLPDFRASERTFQLITQVAGRAGRKSDKPGEVIIQTSSPKAHSILCSVESNYLKFFTEELENRKLANYPPFSRFIVVEFLGSNEKMVLKQAEIFRNLLPNKLNFAEIYGPVAPTIFKIRNNYRRQIIIKDSKNIDPSGKKIIEVLKMSIEKYNKQYSSKSVKMIVDIDSYRSL